jgi:hypothetical protein
MQLYVVIIPNVFTFRTTLFHVSDIYKLPMVDKKIYYANNYPYLQVIWGVVVIIKIMERQQFNTNNFISSLYTFLHLCLAL